MRVIEGSVLKTLRFACCFLLGLALPATAGFQEGKDAYERGDYGRALTELLPLADSGDAAAQSGVGLMYLQGLGVPQDDARAEWWLHLSAQQGYASAQHNLGVLHARAGGQLQDFEEAAYWFKRAADQQIADAQYSLGVLYGDGKGVPHDHALALFWLTLAAFNQPPGPLRDRALSATDRLLGKMTSAEVEKADRLIRAWFLQDLEDSS